MQWKLGSSQKPTPDARELITVRGLNLNAAEDRNEKIDNILPIQPPTSVLPPAAALRQKLTEEFVRKLVDHRLSTGTRLPPGR